MLRKVIDGGLLESVRTPVNLRISSGHHSETVGGSRFQAGNGLVSLVGAGFRGAAN